MRCPQCQKGMGSMVGLDGGVMRAVSRLGFGSSLNAPLPRCTTHLLAGFA